MREFGKDLLRKIKEVHLPGEDAHQIYSPPYRPLFTFEEILTRNPKFAAVNIMLYLKDDEWYFPLILRTENERDRHSGQISLPGGKKEEQDLDFSYTSKRETSEELGIDEHYIRIIREISPIYIPPSNFYVYPYISYSKRNPKFELQKTEVVQMIEFPVKEILHLSDEPEMMKVPKSMGFEVPVINYQGYVIWGATSMILCEFKHILKAL